MRGDLSAAPRKFELPLGSQTLASLENTILFVDQFSRFERSIAASDYVDFLHRIDQGFCIVEMMFDEAEHPTDYRFLEVHAAFEGQTGLKDAIGKTMRSLAPEHEQHWFDIYGHVALTGEPLRFERPAVQLGRYYEVYAVRVGAPDLRRVAILFNDITRRKEEEERLALVSSEIDHRARNLMSLILVVNRRTEADTIAEFKEKLAGRIEALAHSQTLIAKAQKHAPELAELVQRALAFFPAEEERIIWRGPVLCVPRVMAQSIAMALHELTTNAVKYGALSVPEGRLEVSWSWRDDEQLELRWVESHGPKVQKPERQGTGTFIIASAIEGQLRGKLSYEWHPPGLICRMALPAEAFSD